MGKTRYKKLMEMLTKLKEEKGVEIPVAEFLMQLRIDIGDNRETRKASVTMLRELNLIEELDGFIRLK